MPVLGNWLQAAAAARVTDTLREIVADPVAVAVRRAGRAQDLTLTVRILRAGVRGARVERTEASGDAQTDVTILAPAGSDIKRQDRVRAPDGSVYRVIFVMPGQDWRVEADAVVEQ